ncbi:copia protein [Tanacetum coccineum]
MSMMGVLKFFLGIQIHQYPRGIFINQAKYAQEILKKHGMASCDSIGTPMATNHLDADLSGTPGGFDKRNILVMVEHSCILTGSDKLISWSSKMQGLHLMSSARVEYGSLSEFCALSSMVENSGQMIMFHFDKCYVL